MAGLLEMLAAFRAPKPVPPPPPERPPEWDSDIPVMGNPVLANLVFQLQRREPRIGRLVSKVQSGPTEGAIRMLSRSKFQPQDFDKTTLLGVYDTEKKDVFIRPGLTLGEDVGETSENDSGFPTMLQTLIHEFAHAKGAQEDEARKIHRGVDPRLHAQIARSVIRRLYPNLLSRNSKWAAEERSGR